MLPEWMTSDDRVRQVLSVPGRAPEPIAWPSWVSSDVRSAVEQAGIASPWAHQVTAAQSILASHHTVITTGTASGKSLAYLLPVLSETTRPGALTALYIAPTRALLRDQERQARRVAPPGWRVIAVDGDSGPDDRSFAREHARMVMTTPDQVHRSMLPTHRRWRRFLAGLRYIVIDEAHQYRGLFGSHIALTLRRLRRVCALYGADPVLVGCSATLPGAAATFGRLIGEPAEAVTVIAEDTSPSPGMQLVMWEPRGGPDEDACEIMSRLVSDSLQTVTFVRSRRAAEDVADRCGQAVGPDRVSAYRGGYLPFDRRRIEDDLRSRRLMGVAATNALEVGVDVSGLDAVVLDGYPGSRSALWQRAGRAGRAGREALVVLVAGKNPLDAYILDHSHILTENHGERVVLDPSNPSVLGPHLCAAAQEAPLTDEDERWFGPMSHLVDALVARGALRRRPTGWYWCHDSSAAAAIDLRSAGGSPVEIVQADTGRVVGLIDRQAADRTVHPGAVYSHEGRSWVVDEFLPEDGLAFVHSEATPYSTQALSVTDVAVVRETDALALQGALVHRGWVDVTEQVVGYLRRDRESGQVWDRLPLDLAPRSFRTQAVWLTWPPGEEGASPAAQLSSVRLGSGAHAVEHVARAMASAFIDCDPSDLSGASSVLHPDTLGVTVIVHDTVPGGAGFSHALFDHAEQWLGACLSLLESCSCVAGCPSCCVSPDCATSNRNLDKSSALALLGLIRDRADVRLDEGAPAST